MIQRTLTGALLQRFLLAFSIVIVGILIVRSLSENARAHERAINDLNKLADTFAPAAASAAWDFQDDLLLAIARGIGNHPIVEAVTITDSSGRTLAHWQAGDAIATQTPIHVIRALRRSGSKANTPATGTLRIDSSEERVIAQLQQDLLIDATWISSLLLFLLALLWLLIRRLVVLPLSRFSQTVAALSDDRDHLQKIELQPVQVKEITSLQNSFMRLMTQVAQSHEQISHHNAELGQRVSERTAELSEQAQHTRTVLDHIMDAVITFDDQGLIQSFNPAAESIFGHNAADAVGRNIKLLLPAPEAHDGDGNLLNYPRIFADTLSTTGQETEGLRKDGSIFAMELKVSEITRNGHAVYVAMARDITERKRVERMKSEFVATVSHELRTPLTSISGALGLLEGGVAGDLPEQAGHMVAIARRNSLQLESLINDLLDIDKLVAGKMSFNIQPQPLAPIVHEAIATTGLYDAERGIKTCIVGELPNIMVAVDQQRLQQAFLNLLSNAVKFSPPQGTVEVSGALEGDYVRISVRDNGEGIPEAFRPNIFNKFAQADSTDTRQKGGTGLGLAITREIVEHMDGTVGFDSIAGQGATFWLLLPVHAK